MLGYSFKLKVHTNIFLISYKFEFICKDLSIRKDLIGYLANLWHRAGILFAASPELARSALLPHHCRWRVLGLHLAAGVQSPTAVTEGELNRPPLPLSFYPTSLLGFKRLTGASCPTRGIWKLWSYAPWSPLSSKLSISCSFNFPHWRWIPGPSAPAPPHPRGLQFVRVPWGVRCHHLVELSDYFSCLGHTIFIKVA